MSVFLKKDYVLILEKTNVLILKKDRRPGFEEGQCLDSEKGQMS
jgi:hypothetical protein